MSISAMSRVWKHAPYEGNTLLTLLAMADWSNDEGVCWPSIEKIAEKTRQSERNTQYCLERLKEDGAVTLISPAGGRGNPAKYRVNLAKFAPIPKAKGANCDKQRVQSAQEKGAICDSAIRKEPSLEPSEDTSGEDLPSLALAHKIAVEGLLPQRSPGLLEAIAGAIDFLVARDGKTKNSAVEFLLAHVLDETDRGRPPNRFWFDERGWLKSEETRHGKHHNRANENAQKGIDEIRRATAALARRTSAADG